MLPGLKIIQHKKYQDQRGDFCELWKSSDDSMGGSYRQLNLATSVKNVLRGLHRQNQTKLIMPVYGEIFDVALNPETGEWFGIKLDQNSAMLIPPDYAHGYLVLSDFAIVQYMVDAPYNKAAEENFKWDDYDINWPISQKPILSEKDS